MAILITEKTRVIVQGFTGRIGSFHAADMIKHGTNVVGGVTPGRGGESHLDRPLFNTVREAVEATGAEASLVFVPPPFAADAIMEAADAGIRTAVCVTDGIPSQDMMKVKRFLKRYPKSARCASSARTAPGSSRPGRGSWASCRPTSTCRAVSALWAALGPLDMRRPAR
jgi:malate-CoA ligase subunit alpha